MTPAPDPVFCKFFNPGADRDPKDKRRILPYSGSGPTSGKMQSSVNSGASLRRFDDVTESLQPMFCVEK